MKTIINYLGGAFCSITLMLCFSCNTENKPGATGKIVIRLILAPKIVHPFPENYALKEKMDLNYVSVKNTEDNKEWQLVSAMLNEEGVKWVLHTDEPVKINFGFGSLPIVSPGDSLAISYDGEDFRFAGRGAGKQICWNEIKKIGKKSPPTHSNSRIYATKEYFDWQKYLDDKLAVQIPFLDSCKSQFTDFEYNYLKANIVSLAESDRIQTFRALRTFSRKDSLSCISAADLKEIWDSTQHNYLNKWLQNVSEYYGDIYCISEFNKVEVWQQFDFDFNKDSLGIKDLRNYLYYVNVKKRYKGLLRERLLASILDDQTKTELKKSSTQIMLKDYYNQPGFPEYKQRMKEIETKRAQKIAKSE